MKTHKIAIKWKRLSAAMMIVLMLISLGISAYADPVDPPVVVDESEIVAIGAEPNDADTVLPEPVDSETGAVVVRDMRDAYANAAPEEYADMPSTMPDMPTVDAEPTVVVCTAEVNESEVVGIGAEPTVVVYTAEVNESEIVGIGAERTGSETVANSAENLSGSTTAREKDAVPDTGEASYNMVLLPIFLFGAAGMVVFGRKRSLYESA